MGVLELLPLLKRIVPLLSRLAPMLETYLAVRGGAAAGAEQQAALDRMAGQLDASSTTHSNTARLLSEQSETLATLTGEVRHMRTLHDRSLARVEALENGTAALRRTLRFAFATAFVLLLLVIGLVLALLLRHA